LYSLSGVAWPGAALHGVSIRVFSIAGGACSVSSVGVYYSIELTIQCDVCLIRGLGWWAGLVAGLWVGQAYRVFHRPGFGLLVSVPRSLSTQPPFATQALTIL